MRSQQIGHFCHRARFSGGAPASSECMYRIRQGAQKMCPHLAIRGAVGSPKQIGQDAAWDLEDTMICRTLSQSR